MYHGCLGSEAFTARMSDNSLLSVLNLYPVLRNLSIAKYPFPTRWARVVRPIVENRVRGCTSFHVFPIS